MRHRVRVYHLCAIRAGDKTVILWNVATGRMINKLEGHSRFVTSCAFSPDNRLLATGSNDKTVIVWMIDQQTSDSTNGTCDLLSGDDETTSAISCRSDVIDWSVDDVVTWLRRLGLHSYEAAFRRQQIDGAELLHLTHDSLQTGLKVDVLGHRSKILRAAQAACSSRHLSEPLVDDSRSLPPQLLCPITHDVLHDPVVAADGYSYERSAMLTWIASGNCTSPMTNEPLSDLRLLPNRTLANLIRHFKGTPP